VNKHRRRAKRIDSMRIQYRGVLGVDVRVKCTKDDGTSPSPSPKKASISEVATEAEGEASKPHWALFHQHG
jgi:hypothetical protein